VVIVGEPEFQAQNAVKFPAFNLHHVLVSLGLFMHMRQPWPSRRF
jgi:hypothetical protein